MSDDSARTTNAFTRRKPAQGVLVVPGQSTIVFVTVCTRNRKPWLANPAIHAGLVRIWQEEATAWLVGRYVIMPDHIHLFAAPGLDAPDLERWTKFWKSRLTRQQKLPPHSWQDGGQWCTRMRNSKMYEEKWEYVRNNPVRHGLVRDPEASAYAGELFELMW